MDSQIKSSRRAINGDVWHARLDHHLQSGHFVTMPPIDTQTITSKDGTTIYAEAAGDRSKPHVLFVHGMLCDGTAFDPIFCDEDFQTQLYMVRQSFSYRIGNSKLTLG